MFVYSTFVNELLRQANNGFVEQKRVIVNKAQTVIGLVDSTKLGIASLSAFASVDEIDVIITNRGISREMETSLEENDMKVVAV